ncbi:hypothetical protein B0H10DRAFT_2443856 [Mycena sp. CBHHK59/15]|nr:hypothetical protein B0H10DRAFT_2443856 [Mycena sp. CBHHK59/15]
MDCYPTPSPSSHASSLIRAVIWAPSRSPLAHICLPQANKMNNAGCIAALSEDSASRLWIGSPRPRTIVYNLHGLDHESESATTNLGSVQLPLNNGGRGLQSEHLLPLVLPQKAARVSNLGSVGRLTTCQAGEMDVFGPIQHPQQESVQRQNDTKRAAHIKQVRTKLWLKSLRRDATRGALIREE